MSTLLAWCTFFYTREKLLSSSAVLLQFEKRTGTPVLLGTTYQERASLKTQKNERLFFFKKGEKASFFGVKKSSLFFPAADLLS